MKAAIEVVAVADKYEFPFHSVLIRRGEMAKFGRMHIALPRDDPLRILTLELRPTREPPRTTLDVFDIWDENITLGPVTIVKNNRE